VKQAVIESGRAEYALNAVKDVIRDEKNKTSKTKEYKSYVKKFPSLVLSNGLAASVAFIKEKGGAYDLVYGHITGWLKKNGFFADKTLEDYVCSLKSDEYRVVTNEVLALFEWLRRFASGLIEGEAE